MSEVTLHPMPRWRDVVREQVRMAGLNLRREALVVAAVLGIVAIIVVGELLAGGPGFDSSDTFPTALISFLFPFAVWRGERPFGPAALWLLPVDRRRLALAKVSAGGVWLVAALACFAAWILALALLAHASPAQNLMRIPFTATIATYLLGSALVLGLRHPLRWLLGSAGVLFLLGILSEAFGSGPSAADRFLSASGFMSTVDRAAAVWLTLPDLAQWAITAVLSLGAGLAALWAAASRHKENR
jgi:hypothetical protein